MHTLLQMLERELVSLAQDRKLPAFRHRQGMEKKGARTAGGASALLPQARYPAGDQIATGPPVQLAETVTISIHRSGGLPGLYASGVSGVQSDTVDKHAAP